MYLFGGRRGNSPLDELWSYRSHDNSWHELSPDGSVPARYYHTAVWSTDFSCMYVFGGVGTKGALGDLHYYCSANNTWAELLPSGSPPSARFAHAAAWDDDLHRLYVFGGDDGAGTKLQDLHLICGSNQAVSSHVGSFQTIARFCYKRF